MNAEQIRTSEVALGVDDFFAENETILETDSTLDGYKATHEELQTDIRLLGEKQKFDIKDVTNQKNTIKEQSIDAYCSIIDILYGYCDENNIDVFNSTFKYSRTELSRIGDIATIDNNTHLLNLLTQNPEIVTNANVNPERITNLQQHNDQLKLQISKPEIFRSTQHQTSLMIADRCKKYMALKVRIDRYMRGQYSKSNPELYAQYLASTNPPKVTHRRVALKGQIADGATQAPLQNVTIQIDNNGTYRRGGATGSYRFQNLPTGSHSIRFSKNGYTPQSHTINIPDEQTLVLDIQLQPSQNGS